MIPDKSYKNLVDGFQRRVMEDKVKVGSQASSWTQFVTVCVSYWMMLTIHNFWHDIQLGELLWDHSDIIFFYWAYSVSPVMVRNVDNVESHVRNFLLFETATTAADAWKRKRAVKSLLNIWWEEVTLSYDNLIIKSFLF